MAGKLACQSCEISGTGASVTARSNGKVYKHSVSQHDGRTTLQLNEQLVITEGNDLQLEIRA
jgi:hypothetical protein